ncbi:hypothetical protein [Empedobacter sp. 189-2]|uniref:DUF6915 family protein n=1 Tax=Empedobacter sp. 189-2 TaxID=2746724 RepID=UPI00257497A9|nr:hypothetical protein [Empedobacter sp. 189-2]MDM1543909.1 hypothetical protein [Empedobacter sp. 189-2]
MKPHIHAKSSVKKFGGKLEDYLEIHQLLDSSKAAFADNRHRALTHNSWFINTILPKIFGDTIVNNDGITVSVIDIAERHILEDFGMQFIPSAQDYLVEMKHEAWMNGQGLPQSVFEVEKEKDRIFIKFTK